MKKETWCYPVFKGKQIMKKILTFIIIFLQSTTAIAQEAPSCPNGESDASQFCLPGMTWDNESKKCVTLV
jgi:hypothetical protein